MESRTRTVLRTAAFIGVAVLGAAFVAYGLYLLIAGQVWTIVQETPSGAQAAPGVREAMPAVQGVIPLLGGIAVLVGLATRRWIVSWIGAISVAIFAAAFVFGVGGVLLPFAGLLLIMLAMSTLLNDRPSQGVGA